MSDKPIGKGDLVMVVRGMPCCGALSGAEGIPFIVTGLTMAQGRCNWCGSAPNDSPAAFGFPGRGSIEVCRLKRLDPDNLKDDIPTKEELTA